MHRDNIDEIRKLFIGLDNKIVINGKKQVIPINFDNAATTPVLKKVMRAVLKASENYGSIARGDGQKSQYSSDLYEECRRYVIDYFNAPLNKYTAIFIGNTTEGINKLSNILIENKNDIVITSRMEHHSNDLPWRGKCDLKYVEVDEKGRIIMEELEEMFSIYQDRIKYVTITGASNVTGYITDIRRVAKLAHKYGAKLIVDGAQLVPHRAINICGKEDDDYIDFLIFSAHKVYAPFGSGAIIGLRDELEKYPPDTKGGGTVERVLDDEIIWLSTPEKNEAGSPNFFGAVALMQALKEMNKIGFELIESNEKKLLKILIEGMKNFERVILYGDNENIEDRLGIMVFNIDRLCYEMVGEYLASIRGIAVRQGGFCAHPYTRRLLGIKSNEIEEYIKKNGMPGMVRVSLGAYNSEKEVNIFLETIEYICKKCL
ncbi:MAG: aminotransferase class V-fold PLP-dependent enzyme [Clostridium sp.]|uniref:aminotransferase class V-fold PLP-dependent enzyme n=1 Tax=Clostridium sp. TaxID=1506 RepID=UPI002671CBE1|nr:aminotransferase class V-fold PLP-dependent enzyme [Clostridium sp.]MDD7683776.1 aminotransferase class V-fold PLP-dependent enzyme [Clostridium sp.]MDY2581218.1 aminotransferase class V-fold PLP-dependent enzyme [Clostridium sp.]